MARTITGGDHLDCAIGGLVGTPAGAATLATVFRRGSDGTWDTIVSLETSANASKLSMQISDTNNLSYVSAASDRSTNISVVTADGWCLLVVTKASGTSTPRGHKYVYATDTWTHADASSTVGGDSSDLTAGRVQFGRWGTGDPVDGDYQAAGVWKRQLGDAEVETLAHSLQSWYASAPNGLWLLDQSATTQNVIDSTGLGANQQALVGTSVASSSPSGPSYGAGASVGVGQAGGGGAPVTLGQATETDTGTTLGRSKLRSIAQATETDTAAVLSRTKLRAIAQAVETDTATAAGRSKLRGLLQAQETGTADAFGRAKRLTLSLSTETDTAGTFTTGGLVLLGQAVDTGTATALARSKLLALGRSIETDTAGTLSPPSSGITPRPDTGITVRPFTGITARP